MALALILHQENSCPEAISFFEITHKSKAVSFEYKPSSWLGSIRLANEGRNTTNYKPTAKQDTYVNQYEVDL